jgi:peptide chain release factor 2
MQPYQMVKDLRSRHTTGDVQGVLDGELDPFIKAYLMGKASGTLGQAVADDDD